jgi:hypothetical protein
MCTPVKISIIDNPPTSTFEWLIWLETLERSLHTQRQPFVEIWHWLVDFLNGLVDFI